MNRNFIWGQAGGKATAIVLKKQALERYYKSPNICKNCKKVIQVNKDQKVSEVRKKSFCTRSCSGSYNNSHRTREPWKSTMTERECSVCKKVFKLYRTTSGNFTRRKKCLLCTKNNSINSKTKSELFKNSLNWQSARSAIAKNARDVYGKEHKELKCKVCGYDKTIDVAHIKAVSEFRDSAKISTINNIKNLIGLCPNHHWEYDHGLLDLDDVRG